MNEIHALPTTTDCCTHSRDTTNVCAECDESAAAFNIKEPQCAALL